MQTDQATALESLCSFTSHLASRKRIKSRPPATSESYLNLSWHIYTPSPVRSNGRVATFFLSRCYLFWDCHSKSRAKIKTCVMLFAALLSVKIRILVGVICYIVTVLHSAMHLSRTISACPFLSPQKQPFPISISEKCNCAMKRIQKKLAISTNKGNFPFFQYARLIKCKINFSMDWQHFKSCGKFFTYFTRI